MKHTSEISEALETCYCNMPLKTITTYATSPDLFLQHLYDSTATLNLLKQLTSVVGAKLIHLLLRTLIDISPMHNALFIVWNY
jgi:hypothetical protein